MKVFHIHTDIKFLNDSLHFNFENYNNTIIFLGNENELPSNSTFPVICVPNSLTAISKINKLCKNAQIVVLYDLNDIKIALANKLPKNIKVLWRFFGHELYGRKQHEFLSEKTINIIQQQKVSFFIKVKNSIYYRFRKVIQNILFKYNYNFEQAVQRIDIFLCLFEEEYNFLNANFKNLPQFVQIPIFKSLINLTSFVKEKNGGKIIIGNSRNIYNNHIDIFNITKRFKNFNFVLPFNYGSKSIYSEKVEVIAKTQNITIIKSFLQLEAYEGLMDESVAFVLNSYRQMAVGNILIAIKKGMKLYLNKNNIVYKVLKNSNFYIFSIEDLEKDLELKNVKLSEKQVIHNFKAYNNLCNKYTLHDFKTKLEEKLCN